MTETTDQVVESAARMAEAKELIAFYEERGWNWLSALEFTLAKRSGTLEIVVQGPIRTRIGCGRPRSATCQRRSK